MHVCLVPARERLNNGDQAKKRKTKESKRETGIMLGILQILGFRV